MTESIAKEPDSQGVIPFTDQEHQTWSTLIRRQKQTIQNRACSEFVEGLQALNMSEHYVPSLAEIDEVIQVTGWQLAPVTGTVQVDEFFKMLAHRRFPVATFIRIPEELDYLQQPDIFHELFGHCPLLTNQAYADFVQWYGQFASSLTKPNQRILSRLFWFTIEFGLVQSDDGVRVYGGGILSSHEETIYAVESDQPMRLSFDLVEALKTPYRYDVIQDRYFVIDSLQSLYTMMDEKRLTQALNQIRGDQTHPFKIC